MEQYLYHRVPDDMLGNVIYPLNQLRGIHPEIAILAASKYNGRESLLSKQIPPLNCLWNDVVFLLATDPVELNKQIELVGLVSPKDRGRKYFKIPVEYFDLKKIATYTNRGYPQEFAAFRKSKISEYAVIPEIQFEYWRERKEDDGYYLICPYITHILYKGTIDISNAEIITL